VAGHDGGVKAEQGHELAATPLAALEGPEDLDPSRGGEGLPDRR
jgi:hypothetical protein